LQPDSSVLGCVALIGCAIPHRKVATEMRAEDITVDKKKVELR
jgi:hypothetical protein